MSELRKRLDQAEAAARRVLSSRVGDPKQAAKARLRLEAVRTRALVEIAEALRADAREE